MVGLKGHSRAGNRGSPGKGLMCRHCLCQMFGARPMLGLGGSLGGECSPPYQPIASGLQADTQFLAGDLPQLLPFRLPTA